MGNQQLLLLILGVVIVGISVIVGVSLFHAMAIDQNKEAIIADLNNISANCYMYLRKPVSLGGGAGSYANYQLSKGEQANLNANYFAVTTPTRVHLTAVSKQDPHNIIRVTVRRYGTLLINFSYSGEFAGNDDVSE